MKKVGLIVFGAAAVAIGISVFLSTNPSDKVVTTESERDAKEESPVPPVDKSRFVPFSAYTEPVDLAGIPPSLHTLFSGNQCGYIARCRFVKSLGTSLSDAEIASMLLFITSTPEAVGMNRGHFNSVGDKVINKLEEQVSVPPVLIDHLMAMFYDESGDYTWRDYCVQHLGSIYSTSAADGKREAILQLFKDAAHPDVGMAGTAALALKNNVGQEGISSELAAQSAATVALDETQDDADRLTAMLTAAELGNREMLTLALRVVESKNSIHFRMSSMATIGILGDTSDLPTLEKYTSSPDMRLRIASQAAVKKINMRRDDLAGDTK